MLPPVDYALLPVSAAVVELSETRAGEEEEGQTRSTVKDFQRIPATGSEMAGSGETVDDVVLIQGNGPHHVAETPDDVVVDIEGFPSCPDACPLLCPAFS